MTFGKRLRKAREKARLTQSDLGKGLGTDGEDASKSVVLGWEKDRHFPRADQLAVICQRLQCSPAWVLFGDGAMQPQWPFQRVPMARFLALQEPDQAFVEGRLLSAIEECERPGEEARAKELMQPATGRKPLTKRRAA